MTAASNSDARKRLAEQSSATPTRPLSVSTSANRPEVDPTPADALEGPEIAVLPLAEWRRDAYIAPELVGAPGYVREHRILALIAEVEQVRKEVRFQADHRLAAEARATAAEVERDEWRDVSVGPAYATLLRDRAIRAEVTVSQQAQEIERLTTERDRNHRWYNDAHGVVKNQDDELSRLKATVERQAETLRRVREVVADWSRSNAMTLISHNRAAEVLTAALAPTEAGEQAVDWIADPATSSAAKILRFEELTPAPTRGPNLATADDVIAGRARYADTEGGHADRRTRDADAGESSTVLCTNCGATKPAHEGTVAGYESCGNWKPNAEAGSSKAGSECPPLGCSDTNCPNCGPIKPRPTTPVTERTSDDDR